MQWIGGSGVQSAKKIGGQGFRGSPVKFATLLFCEKFNPSTICRSYETGGASRVQRVMVEWWICAIAVFIALSKTGKG
jgi:hypothetical protein